MPKSYTEFNIRPLLGLGLTPNRLHDGVAIFFAGNIKLKLHTDHNLAFPQGSNMYPPMDIKKVN